MQEWNEEVLLDPQEEKEEVQVVNREGRKVGVLIGLENHEETKTLVWVRSPLPLLENGYIFGGIA